MPCSCGCHICCAASCVFPCDQLVCIVCSFAYVTRVPMWMWYECRTPARCSLGWGKREGLVAGQKDRQTGVEWTEQSQAEPRTQLEGSGGWVLLGGGARAGSGLGASNTHIPTRSHTHTHIHVIHKYTDSHACPQAPGGPSPAPPSLCPAVSCGPGTHFHGELNQCAPCPPGTYQDGEGQLSCSPCPSSEGLGLAGARNLSECGGGCRLAVGWGAQEPQNPWSLW